MLKRLRAFFILPKSLWEHLPHGENLSVSEMMLEMVHETFMITRVQKIHQDAIHVEKLKLIMEL